MPGGRAVMGGLGQDGEPVGLAEGGRGHQAKPKCGEREIPFFHERCVPDSCYGRDHARARATASIGNAPHFICVRCKNSEAVFAANFVASDHGSKPSGAISKCSNSKPGATVQPTSV